MEVEGHIAVVSILSNHTWVWVLDFKDDEWTKAFNLSEIPRRSGSTF